MLSKIELKKKDIEKLQEKEKVQMAAFVESIADNKIRRISHKSLQKENQTIKKKHIGRFLIMFNYFY